MTDAGDACWLGAVALRCEPTARAKPSANISHELRTPLQSILGYSELGIVRSRQQPRLNQMFSDVHEAGQRTLALVNDLLDVAKIESTGGTLHLEQSDVRVWVRDVVGELAPPLAKARLRAAVELGSVPLIWAENMPDGGSRFRIRLPASKG